jgi:NADH-quinone oxidoreductase subunit L
MIMAMGAGSHFAGLFHLTTHAAFKALLFLCSGIWIHYLKTNDLFEIAERRGRGFVVPMICLLIAGGSLSGIPPFSGFFSKEAILDVLAKNGNPLWLWIGLLGVFLTAYYAFRPIFVMLFPRNPELRIEDEKPPSSNTNAQRQEKSAYAAMSLPLIVLAAFTLLLGFLGVPLQDALGGGGYDEEKRQVWVAYASLALALFGVALAWFEFGRRASPRNGFFEKSVPLRTLFGNRWYLDHLYGLLLRQVVYRILAKGSAGGDRRVIDGAIDAFCQYTVDGGSILSRLQSGLVRHNFVFVFMAITLVILGIYLL